MTRGRAQSAFRTHSSSQAAAALLVLSLQFLCQKKPCCWSPRDMKSQNLEFVCWCMDFPQLFFRYLSVRVSFKPAKGIMWSETKQTNQGKGLWKGKRQSKSSVKSECDRKSNKSGRLERWMEFVRDSFVPLQNCVHGTIEWSYSSM